MKARTSLRRCCLRWMPHLFLRLFQASTAELGECGEHIAARHLKRLGWQLLGRRLMTPHGEIDVVARDGSELVCVEVKTGRPVPLPRLRGVSPSVPSSPTWRPGCHFDRRSLERQRRAGRWLASRMEKGSLGGGRVDLIEVVVRGARKNAPEILHHPRLRAPLLILAFA